MGIFKAFFVTLFIFIIAIALHLLPILFGNIGFIILFAIIFLAIVIGLSQ